MEHVLYLLINPIIFLRFYILFYYFKIGNNAQTIEITHFKAVVKFSSLTVLNQFIHYHYITI